jgi:hypothetical protein
MLYRNIGGKMEITLGFNPTLGERHGTKNPTTESTPRRNS